MSFDNNDIERLLGWNDGTRMAVSSEALASATVQAHEFQHGRIFHETYDGHLHRLCSMAAGTNIDHRLGGIYSEVSKILFAQTRLAHEAAATYLSIEGLPSRRIRKIEYSKLSRQYQSYYSELDDLVGKISKSSWVRFSFAWTFIHWCFHSCRFTEFFDNLIPTIDPLIDIPSPTDRFLEGRSILKAGGQLQTWVSETLDRASRSYRERGYELWDLNNEAQWNARSDHFEVRVLETELSHFGGDWLLREMPYPTEDYSVRREDFGPGFDMLMKALKLTPSHLYNGDGSIFDDNFRAADLERRAIIHAKDIVEHRPACELEDLTTSSFAERMGRCLEAISGSSHVIILSLLESDADRFAFLCRRTKGTDSPGFKYDELGSFILDATTIALLMQGRLSANPAGYQSPEVWVMLRTSREQFFETMMIATSICGDPANPVDPVSGPNLLIPSNRLILYFDGPWTDMYLIPNVKVTSHEIGLMDDSELGSVKPLSVRIAQLPKPMENYVVSAKPRLSGFRLSDYEKSRFSDGTLEELRMEETEPFSVLTPFFSAWHVWSRF